MTNKAQIPIPPEAFRNRWDFHKLAIGDSIFVPWADRVKLRSAAGKHSRKHPEFRWVSRKMPNPNDPMVDGVRLWRVDKFPGHS